MDIKSLAERADRIKELYAEFGRRMSHKEWGDEEVYQGLVSDVGDLGRLVLAKGGFRDIPNVDESMRHELAEILWATLLLSKAYGVDLERAFLAEMDRLERSLAGAAERGAVTE